MNAIIFGNINNEVQKKLKAFFMCNFEELRNNKKFLKGDDSSVKMQNQNNLKTSNTTELDQDPDTLTNTYEIETRSIHI